MRLVTAAVVPVLVFSGLTVPASAATPQPYRPAPPQTIPAVATRDVPPVAVAAPRPAAEPSRPAPVWPAAGVAQVTLAATGVRELGEAAPLVQAGSLPVSVSRGAGSPGRATVTVFDRARARAVGVDGLIARVASADGTGLTGDVGISIGYGSFATAYGADWATRLRLATLPDCALTTPGRPECAAKPLASRNDVTTQTVSATVPVGALVVTLAASSGGAGDYTATRLQTSSTWGSGGNSGNFSWSYPMRVPPSVGGPAPAVSLAYSSQSVDGMTAANNNQPGWAGGGFELAPGGSIERRYKPCNDDKANGNNASLDTGDLCWATDNAMLSLAGHSGGLIYNATEQRWHLRGDDGTRIERRTGATNGDDNGEWWVVTTTDGTQYWFGRNRLPGWNATVGDTASTWTVPVYGNHTGEPCNAATYPASSCPQAWRWNLDYVIDMNGNSMSLWYGTDINKYAANKDTAHPVTYVRDGWLKKVEYGTRSTKDLATDPTQSTAADSIMTTAAPMEVEFVPDNRCLSGCTTHDAAHWPDVPWDQECLGTTCLVASPTFWTTKRLKQVITKVRNGGSYRAVETWTLTHSYPNPGDGTRAGLELDRIAHAGGADTVPDITFAYVQKNNRVDPVAADSLPPMNWFRVNKITTETGATISVTYSEVDCVKGTKMPNASALENNTYRCYPVRWKQPGASSSKLEFFHKYVVMVVREADMTGGTPPFGSPEVETTYTYPTDAAAWHYTDDDGLIKDENKTWSVWRGYASVEKTVGKVGTGDARQYTKTSYYRGMHGDHLPSGTRPAVLIAVDMNGDGDTADAGVDVPAINDEDAFAGMIRTAVTYNGPGGAEVSSEVNQAWMSAPTASRTIGGVTVHARFVDMQERHARIALDHAPGWRTTSSRATFDGYGMPTQVDDFGDDSTPADNQCRTMAFTRNTSAWILSTVMEENVFALSCAGASNPATLVEADLVSNVRTSYDALAWGTAPVKGMATRVAAATAWSAGSPTDQAVTRLVYDAQGRVIESYDALDRKTTTAYTPATGGPLTQTVETTPSPFLFTTTTIIDPAYGLPTSVVDVNGKRTETAYDGFGRATAFWLPGRDKGTETANVSFGYKIYNNKPSAVISNWLNAVGGYTTAYTLFDGLLRDRQTQVPSPAGGRIVSDTFYDTAGRVLRTYGSYYDDRGGPGEALVSPTDRHDVPTQNYNVYDGLGRVTDAIFDPYNDGERWRTHTVYTGDRTDVTPPAGGTVTSTFHDARGNTTALWQYGYPTATDKVSTTYTVDRRNRPLRTTDAAGNYWEYTYWLSGDVKAVRDPDSGTVTKVYDKAGQLTSTTDAAGTTLAYTYDNMGRKTAVYQGSVAAANMRASWAYDTALFDGTAAPVKGRPASSTRWTNNGTTGYTNAVSGYDSGYRPTGTTVTIPASETGLGGSYTYYNTYRVDGSPESVVLPSGGSDLPDEAVTIGYEPTLGLPYNLTSIDNIGESSLVSATVYDALSRPSQYTLYRGMFSGTGSRVWLSYTRELDTGRLTGISTSKETGTPNVVSNLNYTFDNAGNITKVADSVTGDNQCLAHDALRRLTEAWTPATAPCTTAPSTANLGGPGKYWTTWSIDAVGNRTQQVGHPTVVGGPTNTTTYTYPAAGATQPHTVTATAGATVGAYRYDASGNTTCRPATASNTCPTGTGSQVLTWDPEGHLATSQDSTGTTSYVYDADGNRLLRTDPTGKTLYLPNQEIRASNGNSTLRGTRYYSFNGVAIASRTATGLSWLADDHQGTAYIAIAEGTQAVTIRRQTPFGAPRGTVPQWVDSKGFVGGTVDNTGLTHLGAREYDPALGKFVSVDPVFDRTDPQSMNNFAYSGNSPVTFTDPAGTMRCIHHEECDEYGASPNPPQKPQQPPKTLHCGDPGFVGPCPGHAPRCGDAKFVGPCPTQAPKCGDPHFVGPCPTVHKPHTEKHSDKPHRKLSLMQRFTVGAVTFVIHTGIQYTCMGLITTYTGPLSGAICGFIAGAVAEGVKYLLTAFMTGEKINGREFLKEVLLGAVRGAVTGAVFAAIGQQLLRILENGVFARVLGPNAPMPEEAITDGAEATMNGVTSIGSALTSH